MARTLKRRYQEGQKHHSVKTVYETIELAGIPVTNEGNLINSVETAVEAPVKIKGENKWLSQLGDVLLYRLKRRPDRTASHLGVNRI